MSELRPASGEPLISAKTQFLQNSAGTEPPRPEDQDIGIGRIVDVVAAGNGERLIVAESGLYRLGAAWELTPLRPMGGDDVGWITDIVDAEDGERLIGAVSGLYRLGAAWELTPLRPIGGDDVGWVTDIVDAEDGERLIGAVSGLYRLDAAWQLIPLRPAGGGDIGRLADAHIAGNGDWLIVAASGLYRLGKGWELTPLRTPGGSDVEGVAEIVDAGSGEWLIGPEGGYYGFGKEWEIPPALAARDGGESGRRVADIVDEGSGEWLIGAASGLYRLDPAWELTLLQPRGGDNIGSATGIVDAGSGEWLIGGERGLYRLDGAWELTPLRPPGGGDLGRVEGIVDLGSGERLIHAVKGDPQLPGAKTGLYRLSAARELVPLAGGGDIGWWISDIVEVGSGERLIGAESGLYRLGTAIPLAVDKSLFAEVPNDSYHTFRWIVHHPCVAVLPEANLLGARLQADEGWEQVVVQRPGAVGRDAIAIDFTRVLHAQERGATVTATLGFRPTETDAFEPVAGSERTVRVNWGPWDYAEEYTRRWLPWGVGAQTVLFGALLLAARRSRAAWEVVTDPLWGKVGLWFWAMLRFVPRMQRWVLARWRDALRAGPTAAYLPVPLTGPDGLEMPSTELGAVLAPGRRIWLQGGAGMGKTALVEQVLGDWCAGTGDLGAAFARWGYVPLPIALRDFAQVAVPTAPEEWLFDLAGRRLEAAGLRVEDARLLRGMLTAGYWVLVLDGANEVDDKGAAQQFARRFPQVGMLVTSQAEPRAEAAGLYEVWRLPEDIRAATGSLLKLYLGPERGAEVRRRLEAAPIAADIRSGYDVRLVADLVAAGADPWKLPATRAELYDAMLKPAGKDYAVAELCGVAWGAWVAGRRDLRPGDNIPAALLEPLKRSGVRVVRTQDGEVWQFRHDQMRAYLAARWAAVEEVSPVDLFAATPVIWRLSRSEQQMVWEFFARLLDEDANRRVLAWADEDAERAELQVALRRAWRSRMVGWRPPKHGATGTAGGGD